MCWIISFDVCISVYVLIHFDWMSRGGAGGVARRRSQGRKGAGPIIFLFDLSHFSTILTSLLIAPTSPPPEQD